MRYSHDPCEKGACCHDIRVGKPISSSNLVTEVMTFSTTPAGAPGGQRRLAWKVLGSLSLCRFTSLCFVSPFCLFSLCLHGYNTLLTRSMGLYDEDGQESALSQETLDTKTQSVRIGSNLFKTGQYWFHIGTSVVGAEQRRSGLV